MVVAAAPRLPHNRRCARWPVATRWRRGTRPRRPRRLLGPVRGARASRARARGSSPRWRLCVRVDGDVAPAILTRLAQAGTLRTGSARRLPRRAARRQHTARRPGRGRRRPAGPPGARRSAARGVPDILLVCLQRLKRPGASGTPPAVEPRATPGPASFTCRTTVAQQRRRGRRRRAPRRHLIATGRRMHARPGEQQPAAHLGHAHVEDGAETTAAPTGAQHQHLWLDGGCDARCRGHRPGTLAASRRCRYTTAPARRSVRPSRSAPSTSAARRGGDGSARS